MGKLTRFAGDKPDEIDEATGIFTPSVLTQFAKPPKSATKKNGAKKRGKAKKAEGTPGALPEEKREGK